MKNTNNLIDLHSHMLPEIDDGAESLKVTLQMLKMSYAEGCRHLFLTPHADLLERAINRANGEFIISDKLTTLRKWLAFEDMDMKLYLGSEIFVDPLEDKDIEILINKIKSGIYPTMNGTKYILIEFSVGYFDSNVIYPTVNALIAEGYIPIIAHAERYGMYYKEMQYLKSIGCLLQLNLCDLECGCRNEGSGGKIDIGGEIDIGGDRDILIDRNTRRVDEIEENKVSVFEMARILLREKMYDFIGTDAHGIDRRPPRMKEYVEYLYRNYDEEYVRGIVYENARERMGVGVATFYDK